MLAPSCTTRTLGINYSIRLRPSSCKISHPAAFSEIRISSADYASDTYSDMAPTPQAKYGEGSLIIGVSTRAQPDILAEPERYKYLNVILISAVTNPCNNRRIRERSLQGCLPLSPLSPYSPERRNRSAGGLSPRLSKSTVTRRYARACKRPELSFARWSASNPTTKLTDASSVPGFSMSSVTK